jgi:hypothetical protein
VSSTSAANDLEGDDREVESRPPGDDLEAPPAVEGASISGVVTDHEKNPIPGVRVEAAEAGGADLDLLPVLTDGDGAFRLEGLADGRYDLRFTLGQVKARLLAVPAGTSGLEVEVARPQGILLSVRTPPGRPEPGLVHVVLLRATQKGLVREHFGRSLHSRLLLTSLRPGRYALQVWGGPYLPVEVGNVEVDETGTAPVVDVLLAAEGGTIAGRVLEGAEATQALVGWRRIDSTGPWPRPETSLRADPRGRFALRGLPTGRYRVYAGSESGPCTEVEVDVVEEKTTVVELQLAPTPA